MDESATLPETAKVEDSEVVSEVDSLLDLELHLSTPTEPLSNATDVTGRITWPETVSYQETRRLSLPAKSATSVTRLVTLLGKSKSPLRRTGFDLSDCTQAGEELPSAE